MQLRYVFSELGQGLRRNLSMHLAVILTLFVSLTLVGAGGLLQQQSKALESHWGNQLQITVFLCRDQDPAVQCDDKEVSAAQKEAILAVINDNPEVSSSRVESKEEAFEKLKDLLGPEITDGPDAPVDASVMRESVWITLKDPRQFAGVTSAVEGLDGVASLRDQHQVLQPIYATIGALKSGTWAIAGFLVVAALLLVGNTIRLAALARRREIGIMRLVGASTLYISLPFLLEALVTALIGVALAGGALWALWFFAIHRRAEDVLATIPWIGFDSLATSMIAIGVLGPLLTLVPTLLLTRKYLKV